MSRSSVVGRFLSPRRLVMIVMLTAMWCVLWGTVSAANVLSGLLVSLLIVGSGMATAYRGGIRPLALLRLIWLVAADLVLSTVNVAHAILTPGNRSRESVVAFAIGPEGRHHLMLLVISITLTPGTAVVDVDLDTGTLYLHLLDNSRLEETAVLLERLNRLAGEALPVPDHPSLIGSSS